MTKAKIRESAVEFFMANAGYSYSAAAGETPEQGKLRGAEALSAAERTATELGWTVEWRDDEETWPTDDGERPSEVLCAVLKDAQGNVLGSLGNIGDPDRNYGRVVEAELASEALAELAARSSYSVEPGRSIYRNGEPFISIGREGLVTPTNADQLAHDIAEYLNRRGK